MQQAKSVVQLPQTNQLYDRSRQTSHTIAADVPVTQLEQTDLDTCIRTLEKLRIIKQISFPILPLLKLMTSRYLFWNFYVNMDADILLVSIPSSSRMNLH